MKSWILALALSAPLTALATDFTDCEVLEIVAAGDQNGHVGLSCLVSNRPACAVAGTWVGFDKSTVAGKHYLAVFLTAQAMNARVSGWIDRSVCSPVQGNVALLAQVRMKR